MSANNGKPKPETLIQCPHCDEPVTIPIGTRMECPHCDRMIEKRFTRQDPNTVTQAQLPHTLHTKHAHLIGKLVQYVNPDTKQTEAGIVVGFDPQPRKDPYMPPMPIGEYAAVKCPAASGKKHDFDIKHWPIDKLIIKVKAA